MTGAVRSVLRDIPCAIVRGGTSKGIFLERRHVPAERAAQDRFLCALMGSPDLRQVDGLGGADPLTSKTVLVNTSSVPGVDLEYESMEVAIGEASVNHDIACGNLVSAVGCFAAAAGMIDVVRPRTRLVVRAVSTGKFVEIEYDTLHGDLLYAASVTLRFLDPECTRFPVVAPLGTLGTIRAGNTDVPLSVVDAGALHCFVAMQQLGIDPAITPDELDRDAALRGRIEVLRTAVLARLNSIGTADRLLTGGSLKVTLVGPAAHPQAALKAIVVNREKTHKSLPVSGTIALTVAARTRGTAVQAALRRDISDAIAIEHPGGLLRASYGTTTDGTGRSYVSLTRSARLIMRGVATVPVPA